MKYKYSIDFNHETTTHHIGEESPTAEAKRKAEATSSKTKGKWLKITRKGLLVSAIGRVGKNKTKYSFLKLPNFLISRSIEFTINIKHFDKSVKMIFYRKIFLIIRFIDNDFVNISSLDLEIMRLAIIFYILTDIFLTYNN